MNQDITALYRALDPLRALEAGDEDDALYVDWQRKLDRDPDPNDAKSQLVRAFIRQASPEYPITRLMTGHTGSGKTTELNRVRRTLEQGHEGKRVFVSTLVAEDYLDLQDLQPEDLVLQIVRQLASDLAETGMELGEKRLRQFLAPIWNTARSMHLEKAEVNLRPVKYSFARADYPTERDEFRNVLRGHLPTVLDFVNTELMPAAREHLRCPRGAEGTGYDDVLLVVDGLDKIPRQVLSASTVTNHESFFLDNSGRLRAINCSLLLTVPIELAYSSSEGRLSDVYGAPIDALPLISIANREGKPNVVAENALFEILGRRAHAALGGSGESFASCTARIFKDEASLWRLVRLSGGHVRSLLRNVTNLIGSVDALPISADAVNRYIPRSARGFARSLTAADRRMLIELDASGTPPEDPRFWNLMRNLYVYAYESPDEETWYGLNPLLKEIKL